MAAQHVHVRRRAQAGEDPGDRDPFSEPPGPPPEPQGAGCGWLLIRWLGAALAIYLAAALLDPHVQIDGFVRALAAALVLGLLNALVRPVLIVLTLPITLLTFGLFLLVINALLLQLAGWLLDGFSVAHFGWALVASAMISFFNLLLDALARGMAGSMHRP